MNHDRETWTVAEYVDALRRGDTTAPGRFLRCAKRLAGPKARRLRLAREDAEDAAMNAYCVSFEKEGAALARVQCASTTLCGWISCVLDHLLADVVKALARARPSAPAEREARRATQRPQLAAARTARLGPAGMSRLDELTAPQRQAFDLHLQGLSSTVIAARLGIGRDAVRERISRAWTRLRSDPDRGVRVDLSPFLGTGGPVLSAIERSTLELLMTGESYSQVALRRGESRDAVRSRVHRIRRRAHAGSKPATPRPPRQPLLQQGAHARAESISEGAWA